MSSKHTQTCNTVTHNYVLSLSQFAWKPWELRPKNPIFDLWLDPSEMAIFSDFSEIFIKKSKNGQKSGYFFNKISLISRNLIYMRNKKKYPSTFSSSVYILSLGFWEHDMWKWCDCSEFHILPLFLNRKNLGNFWFFQNPKILYLTFLG